MRYVNGYEITEAQYNQVRRLQRTGFTIKVTGRPGEGNTIAVRAVCRAVQTLHITRDGQLIHISQLTATRPEVGEG